ncbi:MULTISPECIES: NAD(P)H-hydrate dehydratase [Actinoalloteichus]|uniref:Bifunctional NAD(P)H-hydrate repair enzyme n=1 Tax=Actinoalloteichus fjordicus TaxID=1612552 RepID=A0AAC9LGQ6_9PSEU|nr:MULTISPECIES: NAD(P)H-hydrate dehydratase [Actinoalloteichus]APU17598.1 yjeF-like protein, hydroxyethylthiazole kinase-related [Actinoalloteichus fjordicus]APU23674.1 yjeF-like protein, hydroxyethylthiazole kinase-related [Actinoalloteichus sp. GBA129-24]
MRGVWTADQVRAAEERLIEQVPESTLMYRAAFGVAVAASDLLREHVGRVSGARVVLLVGAGSNGGDALWAGAFLRRRGVRVDAVLLAPDRAHPAGLAALRAAGGRVLAVTGSRSGGVASAESHSAGSDSAEAAAEVTARADLVVDGIVGLSARGPLRPAAAALVELVTAPVLAVDLPSGVDPATGEVTGPAVSATRTVTFGGLKPCHVLGAGAIHSGRVDVLDIGLTEELGTPELSLLDPADLRRNWPVPGPQDDKYSQGVVGVAAGSAVYPGAAILVTGAAVHATSGMVRYAGPAADVVRDHWPEVVATGTVADAGRVQAWSVGPGIGTGESGREVLRHVLRSGLPACVDADAITLLSQDETLWDLRDPGVPLVLSPHAGEFARLFGPVGADRVASVRRAAAHFDAVVLLKGNTTVIAAPDGRVLVNQARASWAATAGSGDVLSGLIGALLASGLDPWAAAGNAALLHASAADLAARGAPIGASALLAAVPAAIRRFRRAED